MNRLLMTMAAALALAGAGVAGAQTWQFKESKNVNITFGGCSNQTVSNDPAVVCKATLSNVGDKDIESITVCPHGEYGAFGVTTSGTLTEDSALRLGTEDWNSPNYCTSYIDVIKGVPVQVSYRLKAKSLSELARVKISGKVLPLTVGTTPTPKPAAAPVNINAGNVNITVTGCKSAGNGSYTCTGATITPKR